MSQSQHFSLKFPRSSTIIMAALCFFYITVVLRTLSEGDYLDRMLPLTLALELVFGVLFTLVYVRPMDHTGWKHVYFSFQSLLVLFLLIPFPRLDFFNVLLVLLSYQAAIVLRGRARRIWFAALILLIILSLTFLLDAYGLALSLLPGVAALVFPAYAIISQEIEAGHNKRLDLLADLQAAHQRLTTYSSQVEELAAIQERNRLARELHDSVSQTLFSIGLHNQATRILLERDPSRLKPQLEQLQVLSQNALMEMRSLIADLRPRGQDQPEGPTT